jgi:hypothetical protein
MIVAILWTVMDVQSQQDGVADAGQLLRREYMFALRETLPLDADGWSVFVHDSSCPMYGRGLDKARQCACDPEFVEFVQVSSIDDGLILATRRLSDLAATLTQRAVPDDAELPPEGVDCRDSLARVSAPVENTEDDSWVSRHFARCFDLLATSVDGLRIATDGRMP